MREQWLELHFPRQGFTVNTTMCYLFIQSHLTMDSHGPGCYMHNTPLLLPTKRLLLSMGHLLSCEPTQLLTYKNLRTMFSWHFFFFLLCHSDQKESCECASSELLWLLSLMSSSLCFILPFSLIILLPVVALSQGSPNIAPFVFARRDTNTHTHTVSLTCVAAVIMRAKMTTWNKNVCGLRKRHILSFLDNLCLLSERNTFSRIIVWLWLGIRRLQCLIFVIVAQDDLLLKSTDCPISWGC